METTLYTNFAMVKKGKNTYVFMDNDTKKLVATYDKDFYNEYPEVKRLPMLYHYKTACLIVKNGLVMEQVAFVE